MGELPRSAQAIPPVDEYRALLAVSEAIVAHRDLRALFHELAGRLHEVVRFDYLALHLHEAASNVLRMHVLEAVEPTANLPALSFPVGESPAGLAWQTQQPHITSNVARSLPTGWSIRTENPVRLPPGSEPEPDQCVVRGELTDYIKQHPGAGDVGLLVEIADASLDDDRKMALTHGASGIPVYWIVNLVERQIEVYTSPTPTGYDIQQDYKAGEKVPIVLDGIVVGYFTVSDILP